MKSPQDMRIIQIDITNACIHKCANCTRFCGHHKKPFYMNYETFKKAVDSFDGYKGTIGIMGGEPTLHPEFERFLTYANEHKYYSKAKNMLLSPTSNFMEAIAWMEQNNTFINKENGINRWCVEGFGLWSALSNKYMENYELIQDTFNFQALNDHTNTMYHAPIMIRRKDMGISNSEWYQIRDNCWAQDVWSATITPKGAFFCEIAGALDMLFNGPGGWPIEPGWWKRKPEEFGDQLQWCELCGIALNTFTRDANEEIDDMSEWYYNTLQKLDSPKVKQGLFNVLKISDNGEIAEESKGRVREIRKNYYSDSYFSRFGDRNDWLNPKGFIEIAVSDTNLGKDLNNAISEVKKGEFIVLLDKSVALKADYKEYLSKYVLNPGSILVANNDYDLENELGRGILAVFSPQAAAIKCATYPVIARLKSVEELIMLWNVNKRIPLKKASFDSYCYRIEPEVRYAFYGAGPIAEKLLTLFKEKQIIMLCDSDSAKWGKKFHEYEIISPEELAARRKEFDKVFVGSMHFVEIKTMLHEMGFENEHIVTTLMTL